jgi:hypothetical protein
MLEKEEKRRKELESGTWFNKKGNVRWYKWDLDTKDTYG